MAKRTFSNKAFRNQSKTRAMAGPVKYKWKPLPPNLKRKGVDTTQRNLDIGCDNALEIDNVVTYVFDVLPDGNHSMYVECDYVE